MWHTSDEAPANNQLKLKRANTHITYMAIENIKHLENKIVCKWQIKIVQYKKNPAYGRQSISQPMRIVALIPQ